MFKIEKGIPLKQRRSYPFEEMEVGDSFFVGFEEGNPNNVRAAVYSSASSYGSRHNKRFATRIQGDGVRVWRTR